MNEWDGWGGGGQQVLSDWFDSVTHFEIKGREWMKIMDDVDDLIIIIACVNAFVGGYEMTGNKLCKGRAETRYTYIL